MFRQLTSRFGKKKGGKNGKKGRGRGGRDKRKRRRKRRNQYRDDTLFDRVVDDLPDPQSGGRMFLLVSFALQALIVTFAFIGYHHKRSEFGCCNLWAICVTIIILAVQYPYYSDWCSRLGGDPQWHRANMLAPLFIFTVLFVMWLGGAMALVAHADGRPFFEMEWSALEPVEIFAFWICTPCFFTASFILIALAHMHRNALGVHYYAPREGAVSLVHLRTSPYPVNGSFNYRNLMGLMARFCRVETSAQADKYTTTIIAIALGVQLPFYAFAGVAYDLNPSNFLIIVIVMGLVALLVNVQYFSESLSRRNRKVRKWHRGHLFFPIVSFFALVFVYFFTFGTVFFQTPEESGAASTEERYWEDILLELDGAETAYFTIGVLLMFALLFVQLLLAFLHRKAWAEGTAELDDGLNYEHNEEMEAQLQALEDSYDTDDDEEHHVRKTRGGRHHDDDDAAIDDEYEVSQLGRGDEPEAVELGVMGSDEESSRADEDDSDEEEDDEEEEESSEDDEEEDEEDDSDEDEDEEDDEDGSADDSDEDLEDVDLERG